MDGSKPLEKLDGTTVVPMVRVISRLRYLEQRYSHYKGLLNANRTDADYCAEIEKDQQIVMQLRHSINALLKAKTSSERVKLYSYICSIEADV